LSLSNAARIQSFCRGEKKTVQEKRQIVKQAQGLSQEQCLKALLTISPQAFCEEKERVVSATQRELRLVISEKVYQKIQTLRGMLSHAQPEARLSELLEHLLDLGIAEQQKKRIGVKCLKEAGSLGEQGASSHTEKAQPKAAPSESGKAPKPDPNSWIHPAAGRTKTLPSGRRVFLPKSLTAPIWLRAQNPCEWTGHGKRCSSRYRLQVDHIQPLSQGGANASSNLRILCWAHNAARNRLLSSRSPSSMLSPQIPLPDSVTACRSA
jgi:5-methylcytosine-specific restriction endonuclease McrA